MIKIFVKKNYEFLFCFILLFLIFLISISPQKYITSTYYGFFVWAKIVLPSLFVFFILTSLLQQNSKTQKFFNFINIIFNKIYKTSGPSGYIFFMSIISGYPVGAKLISEFYLSNQISQKNAKKILAFSSTSGPMFILGSVASVIFKNFRLGIIIFISHVLATLLNGLVYKKIKTKPKNFKNSPIKKMRFNNYRIKNKMVILHPTKKLNFYSKFSTKKSNLNKKVLSLNEIMLNTITSVLMVGGFISLSFTLLEILNSLHFFSVIDSLFSLISPLSSGIAPLIFKGVLELTSGCLGLSLLNLNTKILCILLTGLITFGGLSIHFQSNIFLSKCKIKYGFFFLTKTTQTIISIFISAILSFLFL